MKKGLPTTATSILALTLASPAFGKEPYPGFDHDMALAFEDNGKPMELALLSEQEMRETKGAVWPILNVFTNWASRLVTGISFGMIKFGIEEDNNMYSSPVRHWEASNIIYWGFAGVISKHPVVGAMIATGEEFSPDWGVRRIHTELLSIDENYPSLGAFIGAVGSAIDDYSASLYEAHMEGLMAYSSSRPSGGGGTGASLVQRLPQDALRNFFSGLPERKFERYLAGIDPKITRDDFLASLPPETVNKLILTLTERDMNNFVRIIPASIMQPVFDASRHTAGYWRPHWRT